MRIFGIASTHTFCKLYPHFIFFGILNPFACLTNLQEELILPGGVCVRHSSILASQPWLLGSGASDLQLAAPVTGACPPYRGFCRPATQKEKEKERSNHWTPRLFSTPSPSLLRRTEDGAGLQAGCQQPPEHGVMPHSQQTLRLA